MSYNTLNNQFGNPVLNSVNKYILREIIIRWKVTAYNEKDPVNHTVHLMRCTQESYDGFISGAQSLAISNDYSMPFGTSDPHQMLFNPRRIKTLYRRNFTTSTSDGQTANLERKGVIRLKLNQYLNNYGEGGDNVTWNTLLYERVPTRNIFMNFFNNNSFADGESPQYYMNATYVVDQL